MKHFKLANLAPLLLIIFIVKSFMLEPSGFDFGVITLMSYGLLQKLKSDKKEVSEKEEVLIAIAAVEDRYNEKLAEITRIQKDDRAIISDKISTLNLGVQRRVTPNEKAENFGWR